MITGQQFVDAAQRYAGAAYVLGAEHDTDPGFTPADALDCSELVTAALGDLGMAAPDGHWMQWSWCRDAGLLIPLTDAIDTPGALLFVYDGSVNGHVAISRGDGTTIEARGRLWGTGNWPALGRLWSHGALVPGLDYSPVEDVMAGMTRDDLKLAVKEAIAEALGRAWDADRVIVALDGTVMLRLDDGKLWTLGELLAFAHHHAKNADR